MFSVMANQRASLCGLSIAMLMVLHIGCGSAEHGSNAPDSHAGGGASAGSGLAGGSAGASGTGEAGASNEPVAWCEAYKVINCVCQQCHQRPTVHGAAMPLMTYEDTQAPFPQPTSKTLVWQAMQRAVSTRTMPFTGDSSVMPPVEPLSDEQRNTLLTWLAQGALAPRGTVCPMTCDFTQDPPIGP